MEDTSTAQPADTGQAEIAPVVTSVGDGPESSRSGAGQAQTLRAKTSHGGIGHRPGLDGLRAIAVATVIAFHLDRLDGGFLGVDLFFVISGWLITSQLLSEMRSSNTVALRAFWTRRARRLLPASLLVIATVVIVWKAVGPKVVSLRHDTLWSLFWSSNWGTIANGGNYWAHFSAPSPLLHYWSLAVEEQFYLVWPLVALALFKLLRGRRGALIAAFSALTIASIVWMNVHYTLTDPTATYMNTFSRANSLLIGAIVAAITMASPAGIRGGVWFRRLAPFGAIVAVVMMLSASSDSQWLYHWGFPAFAVACVVVIVGAADGWGQRILGSAPMRWIGDRSYGLYLWHWPVVLFLTPERLHATGSIAHALIDVARVLISALLAAVSLRLLEDPIRRRRALRTWRAPIAGGLTAACVVSFAVFAVPAAPSAAPSVVTLPPAAPRGADAVSLAPAPTVATSLTATTIARSATASTTAGTTASSATGRPSQLSSSGPSGTSGTSGSSGSTSASSPVFSQVDAPNPGASATSVPAPARPLRVLVAGDSTAVELADDVDAYSAAHPDQMVAGRAAYGGCGLTAADDGRLHRFQTKDWTDISACAKQWDSIPQRIVSEQIDVVLISIGPWDGDDIKFPNGKIINVLDDQGKTMVENAYHDFVAKVHAAGARIVWVTPADIHLQWGTQKADPLDNPARWSTMRSIIAGLGVQQIDLPDWLTFTSNDGPDGRPDGVHMAKPVDAAFVSDLVAPVLLEPTLAP